jgi:DNA-directed RNA polymerase specialized sigma24 family protein
MSENVPTADLIARLRSGDAQAAAEFVRHYEPAIRLRIRVWLRMQDARLRRVFDSVDICQSVMASFFVRATAGQLDLDQPEKVVGLLVQMARHKLAHQIQKQQAQRRDIRRVQGVPSHELDVAGSDPSPSEWCAGQELLQEIQKRLSPEERRLADRRAEGRDWAAISAEVGGTPDGLRMQLSRAVDRISAQLGLDDGAATEG